MKNFLKKILSPVMFGFISKFYTMLFKRINSIKLYVKSLIILKLRCLNGNSKRIINGKKIRVLYLVHNKSVWKTDAVYQKLLKDPRFDQRILVVPYTRFGADKMQEDLIETFNFFNTKNYLVVNSLREGKFVTVEAVFKPDVVFFSSPFSLGDDNYYSKVFFKYTSYYVPYYYEMSSLWSAEQQYGSYFHMMMSRIFAPHAVSKELYLNNSKFKGSNVDLIGYPAMEPFMDANYMPANP